MRSRLRVVLADRRVTNRELARRLGVSENTVCRWGSDEGIGQASLAALERVASALGCEARELFEEGGSDEEGA